jgi:hypothetical protein
MSRKAFRIVDSIQEQPAARSCHDGGEAQKLEHVVIAQGYNLPSGLCYAADGACQRTTISR